MNAADRILVALGGVLVILGAGAWSAITGHSDMYGIKHLEIRPDLVIYGVGVAMLGAARVLSGVRAMFSRG